MPDPRIERGMRTKRMRYGARQPWGSHSGVWGRTQREEIAHVLLGGPTTSSEIAARLGCTPRTALRHLAVMIQAGDVKRFQLDVKSRALFSLARRSKKP